MDQSERPIAFYDSGIGGLPYLEAARLVLPSERFVYLADAAGFPYGPKTRDEVVELALKAVGAIVREHAPKAVVVACNTATEIALADLRAAFPAVPIVGTVPAIKPAAALSRARRIGVVATVAAVKASYLEELAARWASDCVVVKRGAGELVAFVERDMLDASPEARLEAVRPSVEAMAAEGVDAIVLGCTHFVHLAREFMDAAGPGVAIVDSREGVASQLARVVASGPGTAAARAPGQDLMYLSGRGPFPALYSTFADRFGLAFAGGLYA